MVTCCDKTKFPADRSFDPDNYRTRTSMLDRHPVRKEDRLPVDLHNDRDYDLPPFDD